MDLFGTAGIRGDARERVTPELALAVGRAAGRAAVEADADAGDRGGDSGSESGSGNRSRSAGRPEFAVARDGRVTGPALAAAVEAGLESAGADVRRAGVLPTPALAFTSRGRRGVMLTASHNPPADNGIKLFADGTEYDRALERRVEERVTVAAAGGGDDDRAGHDSASGGAPAAWDAWGDRERIEPLSAYRDAVAAFARGLGAPLDGARIAVDCGNGVASLATPQVLRALGARVVVLNGNVDGHFPGRGSKPTPESLADLRAFVRDGAFAFGVGHDGDADRIVIVDADGEVVHEDTVVAILAERYARDSAADEPVVVTTPNASARIDERVRAAGGRVERVRLGALHEGIADARAAGETVAFAAEPWKHVHTAFGGWIDGVASAAVLARLVAGAGATAAEDGAKADATADAAAGLDALRAPVTERPYRKRSVECPEERKSDAMARLAATLPEEFDDADVDTEYGVRLERPDGSWVLVRPSGTEPYVRVYAESQDVDALMDRAVARVRDAVAAAE